MAKRVLIVATVVKKHIMQFHIPTIRMLSEMGWEVDIAAGNDYSGHDRPDIPYIDRYYDIPIARNPINKDNITAGKRLKEIIDNGNYDVVHCHTPMGGFLTRLCARAARRNGTMVFYTVHGFHFYKGAPLFNWIIYYPIEKYCSRFTDVLITINKEDYALAKARMNAGAVEYIPGIGIDCELFGRISNIAGDNGQHSGQKIILTVGELIKRKNHKTIMDALGLLQDRDIRLVIAGDGKLKKVLKERAVGLGLEKNVSMPGYISDKAQLYGNADLYIQASFQEGLPVSVMEAMASGIPVIASDVRGSRELIAPERLFVPGDAQALAQKIKECFVDDTGPEIQRNMDTVTKYDQSKVLERIRQIYEGRSIVHKNKDEK